MLYYVFSFLKTSGTTNPEIIILVSALPINSYIRVLNAVGKLGTFLNPGYYCWNMHLMKHNSDNWIK